MIKEIRRQTIHFLGIILAIIIIYQDFYSSLRLLAALVLVVVLINWYYNKRYARRKSFRETIDGFWLLSKKQRGELVESTDKFHKFEEKLFNTVLESVGIRENEKDPTVPPFYFLLSSLICLIFLGKEITVIVIITLSVGDALSALIGKKFGKHKIFWSKKKSIEGSVAFFVSTFIAIYVFLYLFPSYIIFSPLILSLSAAFFGALIETEPTLTDNFSIPVFTGFMIYLVSLVC